MNPVRFIVNALGAGVGIWVGQAFVAPMLGRFIPMGDSNPDRLGIDDIVVGVVAMAGALAANMAYSRISK